MFLAMILLLAQTAPPADSYADTGGAQPRPQTPIRTWVTDSDYPFRDYQGRAFGLTKYQLDIDATGKPSGCHILNSSGFWALDERTCEMLMTRGRFSPATDARGAPVASYYRGHFVWDTGDTSREAWVRMTEELAEPHFIEVTVQKLPAGYKLPPLVRVRFGDKGGEACRIELTSGSAAIDKAACSQAQAQGERPDTQGLPMRKPDARMYAVAFAEGAGH